MAAFDASVELSGGFVPAPRLQEPPEGLVVPALRAFDLGRRKRVELRLLVPHDLDLGGVGQLLFGGLPHSLGGRLAGVATVVTDIRDVFGSLDLFQLEPGAALRTELQSQEDPPPRAFLTPSYSSWVVSIALSTLLAKAFSGFIR